MKVWVYLDGRQQGPFDDIELTSLEGFGENTKVWFEGLAKWQAAGELEQLAHLFGECEENPGEVACEESAEVPPRRPEAFRPAQPQYAPQQRFTPQAAAQLPTEPCPPTYVGWAIFLFLCCCSPFSLAALAGSICVTVLYGNGKLDKAKKASEITAWLIMLAIALGMFPVMFMSAFMG